jgi:NADH dehydrogenase FAD-containing subunit
MSTVHSSPSDEAGIVCIGGGISTTTLLAAGIKEKVTVIMANPFLEWGLASTYFISKPDDYMQFVSPNKESFEIKGADYIYDAVVEVKPEEKAILLKSGRRITYKVLIVCTGFKLPVLNCEIGVALDERKATVDMWGAKIIAAKTVVINGAGAIGFELAGDIKCHYPEKRVVVLTRSGKIFNEAYPEDVLARIRVHIDRLGIEVVKGSVAGGGFEPLKDKGSLKLEGGDVSTLEYDVFFPAFMQGVNTEFLPSSMLEEGRNKFVKVNEFLQSTAHPEIFCVGCNNTGEGFIAQMLEVQAKSAAKNAMLFLEAKALVKHEEDSMSKGLNWGARPSIVKIGYGPGGFTMFDNTPAPITCCLTFCGFPFCPPPCCYPCCGGVKSAFACGWCLCGRPEGEDTMNWFIAIMGTGGVKMFPKNMNFLGVGEDMKRA